MKLTRKFLKKLIMEQMNLSPVNEAQMSLGEARAALASQFEAGGPFTVAMLVSILEQQRNLISLSIHQKLRSYTWVKNISKTLLFGEKNKEQWLTKALVRISFSAFSSFSVTQKRDQSLRNIPFQMRKMLS